MYKSNFEKSKYEQQLNLEPKLSLNLLNQTIIKPNVNSNLVKVYEALYNPMTYESSYGTLSIHLSKEGAEKAIAFHKMEKIKEWKKLYPIEDDEPYKFGEFEDWMVQEIEILP